MTISNAESTHESPIAASTDDVSTTSSNTAAVLTYTAGAARAKNCVAMVAWSYSGAPTAGSLKIEDGSGNVVFKIDITAAGPGAINFQPPKKGSEATALIVTLAAGGSGVSGKLSTTHWAETDPAVYSSGAVTAPAQPTNLAAYGGIGGAYISWTASAGAATYDLQSSSDNSTWSNLSAGQAGTTYSDSTGNAYYRVRANNAAGSSSFATGVAAGSPLPNALTWLRSVNGFTVSTWTDQSGSGNNATQATGGNTVATSVLGGKSVARSADASRLMNLPPIIPTAGSFTLVALFRTSDETAHNNIFCGTQSDFSTNLTLAQGQTLRLTILGGSTNPDLVVGGNVGSPQTNWALAVVTTLLTPNPNFPGAGNSNYIYNNQIYLNNTLTAFSQTPQPNHPTQATVSIAGIQGAAGFGFIGDLAEIAISSTQPTAAEMNRLANMVNATYGLTVRTFSKQVLFIGDSLTNGGKATTSAGCWAFLVAASDTSRYYVNQGYPGGMCSDLIAAASTALYPYTSCGVPTTCTIMFGTNDMVLGKSGATIYADIQTLVANLRAHGDANLKIVVCTMLPESGQETQRQALNNALRANHSFADAFFDVETVAAIGAAGANTNATYYDSDTVHLNDTGHAAFYAGIAPILASVW